MMSSADRQEAKKASPSHAKENRTAMHRDDIMQVQEILNDKGFDVGPADGVIGARTRAGIRSYQKAEKLPVTGRLDKETAERLGVEAESLVGKL
jgi:peptidoglycan hydrolase-like protein with peptidoglycan-binding domain